MKIVIISDIHANYDALSALPEIGDELWVLGDLVNYGPQPLEVIEFLQSRATLIVSGNHDYAVGHGADPQCSPRFRRMAEAAQRFTESVVAGPEKQFLRNLPEKIEVERAGFRFFLCHATPSDPLFAYYPPDSEQWIGESEIARADFLLVGHTHLPFVWRIGNRTVANPGSLGQPKGRSPKARYAIWQDGTIRLLDYEYPVERTVAKIEKLPLAKDVEADLIAMLRTGVVPTTG